MIREPEIDFAKLVDKLEQAERTMKLEETQKSKLHTVSNIQTTTSHMNNIQEADNDLAKKPTQSLNINKKIPN